MAQMVSVDEALSRIIAGRLPAKTIKVELSAAKGMTLAEPVIANRTQPENPVSAMDGYAVKLADVAMVGRQLNIIGEAPAGHPFEGTLSAGEAVRIFTGAELPDGADHVVIQEDTNRDGDLVTTTESFTKPANVRAAGIDFTKGDILIEAGTRIGSAELAIAAAANLAQLSVYRKPRIGILANGDELKPPGSTLKRGEIVNSNPYGLSALISNWGGEAIDLGTASDSVEAILEHMSSVPDIDIFLPVGGASVGDYDFVREAFSKTGFEEIFPKIAVKPGKPTWFGTNGAQRVLGLPGNPASAFVCAQLFLAPLIGVNWTENEVSAKLKTALKANGGREQFLRAKAQLNKEGYLEVEPAANQDSSLLRPFLTCNALIRREGNASALEAGDTVKIVLSHL